jgi:hypothetical protein
VEEASDLSTEKPLRVADEAAGMQQT